jgi:hypothetical protein
MCTMVERLVVWNGVIAAGRTLAQVTHVGAVPQVQLEPTLVSSQPNLEAL